MTSYNPIRQVLQNLANEFQSMNTNCLHFNVEINALIEERTNFENRKFMRRLCQCLRFVDFLKPETSDYYKDKSAETLGMLRHLEMHYDDLKRRYMWALDQLAELTMKLKRMLENHEKQEARNRNLGKSWKDFCRIADEDKHQEEKEDRGSMKSTDIGDVDKLLGLMFLDNGRETSRAKDKRRKSSGRVYTKVTKSPKLTKIEDFPCIDGKESGDHSKSLGFPQFLRKFQKIKPSGSYGIEKSKKEMTMVAEMKMEVYALMAEIAERDDLIESLVTQMKIKDVKISQLLDTIHQEKLGLRNNRKVCKNCSKAK